MNKYIIFLIVIIIINNFQNIVCQPESDKLTILGSGIFVVVNSAITLQLSLDSAYSFLDYDCQFYINIESEYPFRNQSNLCLISAPSKNMVSLTCTGLDGIGPDAKLTSYFNPKVGNPSSPVFNSIILIRVTEKYQILDKFEVIGSGFNLLDPNLVKIKDSYDSTELSNIVIEPTKITVSLSKVSSSTNGVFWLYITNKDTFNYFILDGISFFPYISSVSPTGFVNSNDDLTITGIFLIDSTRSLFTFTLKMKINNPSFDFIDKNTIIIKSQTLKEYYGYSTLNYRYLPGQPSGAVQSIPNPYSPVVLFASATISSANIDLTNKLITLNGDFIDSTLSNINIQFYLNGISYVPINSSSISRTSVTFPIDGIQLFYGGLSLLVDSTETTFSTDEILNILSPLPLEVYKRVGRTIYFSGKFLSPNNKLGQTLYIVYVYRESLMDSLPCTSIQYVSYDALTDMYNMSCISPVDIYPLATKLIISSPQLITSNKSIPIIFDEFSVDSISSTIYGIPNQIVTITGKNLNIFQSVTIGGIDCTNVQQLGTTTLKCLFISNVGNVNSELPVFLNSGNGGEYITFNSFIYGIDQPCPINNVNGLICSGITNGKCLNTTRECLCNKGFGSFDCSTIIIDKLPPLPIINSTITTIETNSNKFEIGLIEIREIESYNNNKLIKSIDLKKQIWDLSSTITSLSNITTYTFNTTTIDKCIIKVLISVYKSAGSSSGNNVNQYNFFGDTINILPNSIKYYVEISNWQFNSKLNSIQVLFESKIENQCDGNGELINSNIEKSGESIRSIEMKLSTGEILIGKFSNRMKIDNRIVVSNIILLPNEEKSEIQRNNTNLIIQAINVGYFNDTVIIDPNFGVLLSSNQNDNQCNNSESKSRKWVIPVAVVVSVVGAAILIISVSLIYKKIRNNSIILDIRLKLKPIK